MFKEIFGSLLLIFVAFNAIYYLAFPEQTNTITMEAILIVGANMVLTGAILGISVVSTGLNSESIALLVSAVGISLLLFSIPIGIDFNYHYYGFNLGLGLVTNIANKFGSELLGYPFWLVNLMGILALVSGLMVVAGND